ncbi:Hypothetical_protein [Hexamita inflata]|uniref:Hypothetical_protein n=1 Tax=Hexamita inflata TaxID=28002 RepID=A0AA86UWY3_9EUKA|nr:Hypothetical protein HINF_LOCUS58949 [Hexamita inflata]
MKHIQQSQSYSGKLQNSSIYLQKPFVLKNQKQETKLKEILPVTDEIHYYSAQEDILNNQTRISALNQQLEMQNGLYNRTFSNKMRDQIQFMQKNINKQLSQFESQLKKEMSLKLQDITEQLIYELKYYLEDENEIQSIQEQQFITFQKELRKLQNQRSYNQKIQSIQFCKLFELDNATMLLQRKPYIIEKITMMLQQYTYSNDEQLKRIINDNQLLEHLQQFIELISTINKLSRPDKISAAQILMESQILHIPEDISSLINEEIQKSTNIITAIKKSKHDKHNTDLQQLEEKFQQQLSECNSTEQFQQLLQTQSLSRINFGLK